MLKNYIWDLDGTLIDSYDCIVSSLVSVAESAGADDSYEDIMKAVKRGSVSAYLRGLADRYGIEYEETYRSYRNLSHEQMTRITLIPGAEETLRGLRDAGAEHFVYTHRGQSTGALLERLNLADYFTEVVTFERGFRPKPSGEGVAYLVEKYGLDRDRTVYVGDRALDVLCGKDAGVKAVLYLPEGSCVEPTGEEDRIIGRLEELLEP